ncbi:MAG: TonB-dependent siderophore receptor, partial [Parvularculaceae bacterium]|nr:TonB-dependent siderophore receptor [Parvularculaceae bacterium]
GLQDTRSATKTDTPLVDIPQTVSVITKDLMDDQAMRSLADVVRYAPGVVMGQGEGHRDQITIRGSNSTADFFVDGVRDDIQYYRGLYNLERVEVLKGPNALIFGRGGGGGVVNRVLKRPRKDDFAAAAFAADTFGAWRTEADANATLGQDAAARLNAVYEKGRSHRDAFELERVAVNPTVRINAGPSTRFDLSYEYAFDERRVDRGVPSEGGRPAAGVRDAFFGDRDRNAARFNGHFAGVDVVHAVSDALEANAKLVYGDFDKFYDNVFPATPVATSAGGAREIGIEAYSDSFDRRNFFAQGNLVWKVETGPARHVLLVGAEFGDQRTTNARLNGFFDSGVATTLSGRRTVVPFTDPFAPPPATFRSGVGERLVFSEAKTVSAYVQDQIELGDHVEIIAGVRRDNFRLDVDNLLSGQSFRRRDDVWSPRAGLVLKPASNASVYGSFSRSFLPQSGDQFVSLDLTLAALEPERFENREIGAKWDATKSLSFAVAVYRLDRENTRAPGAAPGTVVLTGAQRSRGVEFSAVGALTKRWSILAGATFQKSEVTATTAAAPAGREAALTPRRLFTLWTRYDATSRLGFGLGVQRQGASFASISNAVALPAFTRLDAALFWRISAKVEAQVNVDNLLNADYFPTAHNDNNISTGAPRAAIFTLKARI